MAKPKRNGRRGEFSEDPPPGANGHNSGPIDRAKALDAAIEKHCVLQAEEDRLIEKYIHPIRDKKAKNKAALKADYGIPTPAFNARAALRLIEKQDDDEIVLAVNELFAACPVGHNVDLVALADRVKQKAAEKAEAKAKAKSTETTAAT